MAPNSVCTRNPATNGTVRVCATEVSRPRVATSQAARAEMTTSHATPEARDQPMYPSGRRRWAVRSMRTPISAAPTV